MGAEMITFPHTLSTCLLLLSGTAPGDDCRFVLAVLVVDSEVRDRFAAPFARLRDHMQPMADKVYSDPKWCREVTLPGRRCVRRGNEEWLVAWARQDALCRWFGLHRDVGRWSP